MRLLAYALTISRVIYLCSLVAYIAINISPDQVHIGCFHKNLPEVHCIYVKIDDVPRTKIVAG